MSRKGFLLFLTAGLAWGIPYFYIRIAAEEFSAPAIVFARTLVGAAVLLPLAIRRGALKPALKAWKYVLAFAILEMMIPWIALSTAEAGTPVHINSGLAGLLIATVPFFATCMIHHALKHNIPFTGLCVRHISLFFIALI